MPPESLRPRFILAVFLIDLQLFFLWDRKARQPFIFNLNNILEPRVSAQPVAQLLSSKPYGITHPFQEACSH